MGSNTVKVEFKLTMPHIGSWNGKWSYGEGKNFTLQERLPQEEVDCLFEGATKAHWYHPWNDGWTACITARIMSKGERSKPSDGFMGYEWMVVSIINYGRIKYERT